MVSTQARLAADAAADSPQPTEHVAGRRPPAQRAAWGLALLVFVGSFVLRFLDPGFTNDHFRLLAQARQILEGELPFRDFVDPGVFLQIQVSALFQRVFGYSLFGEALLCILFLSAGYALTFVLSARAAGSILIALVVTASVVAMYPRLYSYDKIFLLALGVAVLWRYADRPTTRNLGGVALCTAVAFLVRHDHGVYIAAGAAATLLAVHWRAGARQLLGRLALYAAFGALPLLPFLAFLEVNGGAVDYFVSAVEYTRIRGEGKRENLDELTSFALATSTGMSGAEATPAGPGAALLTLLQDNAIPWLYHLFVILPAVAVAVLLGKRLARDPGAPSMPAETAKILGLAVLCLAADRLLLRHPLEYRIADAATPTAVIAAWLLGKWLVGRPRSSTPLADGRSSDDPGGRAPRHRVLSAAPAALRRAAALAVIAITWLSIADVADLRQQVARIRIGGGPTAVVAHAADVLDDLTTSPPIDAWAPVGSRGFEGLVRYVHECTKPTDRLLVTWFAPDAYYYSGRGFAGGQLFWFSDYAESQEDEQEILDKLRTESVPVIITRAERYRAFADDYALVHDHIESHYRVAAESGFGHDEPYRVFVDTRLTPSGTYRPLDLPCFR